MSDSGGFQWGAIGALVGAALTGLFAWLTQRSKGRVDESIAVRDEWEKLTGSLAAANETLRGELAAAQKLHVEQMAEKRTQHEAELKAMRIMNEGLLRIIAQNSQSKAQLLSLTPVSGGGDK